MKSTSSVCDFHSLKDVPMGMLRVLRIIVVICRGRSYCDMEIGISLGLSSVKGVSEKEIVLG